MKNFHHSSLSKPRKVPRCSVIVSANSDLFRGLIESYKEHLRHQQFLITDSIFDHVINELGADDIFRVQYTDTKPENKYGFCDPMNGYLISWSSETVFSASILTHGITPAEVYSWLR